MSDLKILKELIIDEALVTIEDGLYGKPKVTLVEPKNQCHPEYTVDINNIPKNSIVIKTDTFPAPKHIFNGSKGECKHADFVIIAETMIKNKPKNLIIFIELKKGKGNSQASIIQQLKGAQCIIAYYPVQKVGFAVALPTLRSLYPPYIHWLDDSLLQSQKNISIFFSFIPGTVCVIGYSDSP